MVISCIPRAAEFLQLHFCVDNSIFISVLQCHLCCVTNYYFRRHQIYKDLRPYEDKIRRILETIIRKGIALEMSRQYFEQHEGEDSYYWIVEMYYEMGGYLLTIGTDAHAPKVIGAGYPERIEKLINTGFTHMLYYKDRKAVPCSLENVASIQNVQ